MSSKWLLVSMWSLARPCVLLSSCQLLSPGAARLRPFQSPEQWRQQSSSSSARPRTAFSSVPSEPTGGGVGCGHLVPAHHLLLLQPAEWGGGGGRGGQGGEGEKVEVDLVHLLSAGTESQVFRLWTQLLLTNYLSEYRFSEAIYTLPCPMILKSNQQLLFEAWIFLCLRRV